MTSLLARLSDPFGRGALQDRLAAAEQRAEAAEGRLKSVVDSLPEGIVLLDQDGRYVLWNQRYAEIYHRSADLFQVGRRLVDTLRIGVERGDYPEAIGREEAWLAEREAKLKQPGARHEQQIADGTWLMIEERRTRDGGTVGLRVDITQMKRQAQEIEANAAQRAEVMDRLGVGLSRLSDGDLACAITERFPAEYEPLRDDFNQAAERLAGAFGQIAGLCERVSADARSISRSADQLSLRTEGQAATLEETVAALDVVTTAVLENADGAARARSVAAETLSLSADSNAVVQDTIKAMADIQVSAKQVEGISEVINELAFHTQLLALNTSIEAAHAGAAGAGFAIIAAEVRTLAERSAQAAREIKDVIAACASRVDDGAALVARTGEAFGSIIDKVGEINGLVVDMAASAQEQSVNLIQVNRAAMDMDRLTQANAAMVQETTAATHDLMLESQDLREQISRFRFGTDDESPRQLEQAA